MFNCEKEPGGTGTREINCRKAGTGESLANLAEYIYVFMLFTFISELKETTTQHNFFYHVSLNELSPGNSQGSTAYYSDAWIIVHMFD